MLSTWRVPIDFSASHALTALNHKQKSFHAKATRQMLETTAFVLDVFDRASAISTSSASSSVGSWLVDARSSSQANEKALGP